MNKTERQKIAIAIRNVRDMLRDPLRRPVDQYQFDTFICGWQCAIMWLVEDWTPTIEACKRLKSSYLRFVKKYPKELKTAC